ncbi:MAG: undecaprenyl/decaprenyl-phosphate alpha-N-acetylglucosaminyl 1-phosphate transferase [Clostridiales bacterium]|jgi:UDP-GlcNAc:undecaprenyl-phosphate GlcNAc-1-phosphate transferase|nr:undecaprenyl/decaprenyl-phosphate alpha-N-acetylglucosaminyl 1-phosphate transferase [Clostridiales bacterium]
MNYAITMLIALIVAFIATPLVKRFAFRIGAVDIPKDDRRMHQKPIALLGGFAIIVGFLVALFYNLLIGSITPDRSIAGLLTGILVLLVCGFLDDKFSLSWKQKAVFQVVAAVLYVLISDMQIDFFTNPFVYDEVIELSPLIAWPLTILWIVGITIAINFVDGLDGLAAGVSCISALSLFFVSVLSLHLTESAIAPVLMAALAGAAIGFLPFNFNPAKIFMGETGAAFLGFTLAVVSIQGMLKSYAMISLAIPILIIGLPIFDVAFSVIRRVARGASPARSDGGHIHHKLIGMGLSQRQSVVLLYITSAVLGLCGFIFANKNIISAVILLILLPVFVFACAKYFIGENAGAEARAQGEDADDGANGRGGVEKPGIVGTDADTDVKPL